MKLTQLYNNKTLCPNLILHQFLRNQEEKKLKTLFNLIIY
jgi:hypothetical protein